MLLKYKIEIDEKHIYRVDGIIKPGLTQILKSCGFIDDRFFRGNKTKEGELLHLAARYLDEERLDPETLDPRIAGKLKAYEWFKSGTKFKPRGIEIPLYDHIRDFCCTPDRWGEIDNSLAVVELKAGLPAPWHQIQTALQSLVLAANDVNVTRRYALYLRDDETYTLERHSDLSDINIANAVIAVYRWRQAHGVLGGDN